LRAHLQTTVDLIREGLESAELADARTAQRARA
jgi:hypothetical protein